MQPPEVEPHILASRAGGSAGSAADTSTPCTHNFSQFGGQGIVGMIQINLASRMPLESKVLFASHSCLSVF